MTNLTKIKMSSYPHHLMDMCYSHQLDIWLLPLLHILKFEYFFNTYDFLKVLNLE